MKFVTRAASSAAVVLGAVVMFANSAPGYALQLQDQVIRAVNAQESDAVPMSQAVEAPLPQIGAQLNAAQTATAHAQPAVQAELQKAVIQATDVDDASYASLSDAVESQEDAGALDDETNCLATSIYYESKGEPLSGQLAVAHVILNRTESGRFPRSVCGVVKQRGQFAFVRNGQLPTAPHGAQWNEAVAVAKVAIHDLWKSPAPGALYFHARYVRPNWRMAKVAALGNHVFYR